MDRIQTEFRPLLGKWSEFGPAQKKQSGNNAFWLMFGWCRIINVFKVYPYKITAFVFKFLLYSISFMVVHLELTLITPIEIFM